MLKHKEDYNMSLGLHVISCLVRYFLLLIFEVLLVKKG